MFEMDDLDGTWRLIHVSNGSNIHVKREFITAKSKLYIFNAVFLPILYFI
jgi:hypothetical protein